MLHHTHVQGNSRLALVHRSLKRPQGLQAMSRNAFTLFGAVILSCIIGVSVARCPAQSGHPRTGFSEEFDTVEGWKAVSEKAPLASMTASNGIAVFQTYCGSFAGAKPPDQPIAVPATSTIYKEYDQEVDLDKYHYVVMKIDEKSMYSMLEINRRAVQVAYTTGVIAQDLRPLAFGGKQRIRLDLSIMNNARELRADYVRLVSELSDKERAGLIPPPVRLFKESVDSHLYQRLEALNQRSARVWRDEAEEKVVFRDVGTGAVTWRMTAHPADEGFSERFAMWTPNGSAFCGRQGYVRTYLFEDDQFLRGRIEQLNPPKYSLDLWGRGEEVKVYRRSETTGERELIYQTSKDGNLGVRGVIQGDKIVVLVAGVKLAVVDGAENNSARRVREFPVPEDLSAKGGFLSEDGKWFEYFSPFGCYLKTLVNTETGQLGKGSLFTFTHGMNGPLWSIMSYGEQAKLQVSSRAFYAGNSAPGDLLKVHGVYLDPVATDYGAMTADGRYGYTNGLAGELAAQHVMFDRMDPGSILRLCTYHVSKINWHVWTKTIASPDYTKLMYVSDMLGNSDYYMAIIRAPDPPSDVRADRVAGGVRLTWRPPERRAEIKGYNVYRASTSGINYRRLNRDLITACEFIDSSASAGDSCCYLVAAQEYSGLEGAFSSEACVALNRQPVRLHYEAEAGEATAPMREVFDGHANGYRGMRVTKVAASEDFGSLRILTDVSREAKYWVWGRCRNRFSATGAFALQCADPGSEAAQLRVSTRQWRWVRSSRQLRLAPPKEAASLRFTSGDDGLAIDKIIVTDNDAYRPHEADDRTAAPEGVTGLRLAETTPNSATIAWQAPQSVDHHYCTVYVGDRADFRLGNETVLCSGFQTTALDWDIKPAAK
jgi:hypothetical protein